MQDSLFSNIDEAKVMAIYEKALKPKPQLGEQQKTFIASIDLANQAATTIGGIRVLTSRSMPKGQAIMINGDLYASPDVAAEADRLLQGVKTSSPFSGIDLVAGETYSLPELRYYEPSGKPMSIPIRNELFPPPTATSSTTTTNSSADALRIMQEEQNKAINAQMDLIRSRMELAEKRMLEQYNKELLTPSPLDQKDFRDNLLREIEETRRQREAEELRKDSEESYTRSTKKFWEDASKLMDIPDGRQRFGIPYGMNLSTLAPPNLKPKPEAAKPAGPKPVRRLDI